AARVTDALRNGELTSGRGLNQETSLKRACDTRWGSHYGTVLNLITMFSSIIDVLENIDDDELSNHFDEMNTELLLCGACLNPDDSFLAFDKQKLIHLAQFYPFEFSAMNLMALDNQLETYIIDMRTSCEFSNIKGIGGLANKLVETKKDIVYPLVLVKLTLILPVATASVERVFSAMKYVKNRLRNRMRDSLMNNCLVTYIEKDVFSSVDNETVIQHFQKMKIRR
ncbi:LOW QUALITY PROTEIN: Dimer_Tnp_hAT domain-containing protein, partial [Cephalotus follicularis]